MLDSHAHLDDKAFDGELDAVLQRAREAGVDRILTVGTDAESSRRACRIASEREGILAAVGIHPHTADAVQSVEALRPLTSRAVAIGETGLDYAKRYATAENQKALFAAHLELAKETGLPVILHCRDAHADCRAMVREHFGGRVRGVVHCFSGGLEDARDYLDLGMYLSIAGPVTYPNARALREVVATLPLDRLLAETDCPLLAPQRWRGKRNEPAYLAHTVEALAELFRVPFERMAEVTSCNAQTLFARS